MNHAQSNFKTRSSAPDGQGAPLSNLLCNIYLSPLDSYLEPAGIPFVRCADDVVLFAESEAQAARYFQEAECFLREKLGLGVNHKKCAISATEKLRYLGFRFESKCDQLDAVCVGSDEHTYYQQWHSAKPKRNRRRVDILRDGMLL